MAKLTLTDVANLTGAEATAISTLNANWDAVVAALDNTLSRDGTTPNTMSADFDMNSNDILNANVVNTTSMVLGGVTVTAASGMVSGASVLAALLTADGAGSGLDADLLDGNQAAAFPLVANNLSDLASVATARTNLGVAIGSDVQAWNANLDTLASIAPGAAGQAILADATAQDVLDYLAAASTDVSFLQAGTGATSRTVRTKLRDFVDIKDFGAVGDGVTNDSAAVQAWLTYITANNKTGYVSDGTYLLNSAVTASVSSKRFAIIGQSMSTSVFKTPSTNTTGAIIITGASRDNQAVFDNFTIETEAGGGGTGLGFTQPEDGNQHQRSVICRHVTVKGSDGTNDWFDTFIDFTGTWRPLIEGCTISGPWIGVDWQDASNRFAGATGLQLQGAYDPTVDKNHIWGVSTCIQAQVFIGTITGITDNGGGTVRVTLSEAYPFSNGVSVVITGTTDYNGTHTITTVSSTTFDITATYVSSQTGTCYLSTGPEALRLTNNVLAECKQALNYYRPAGREPIVWVRGNHINYRDNGFIIDGAKLFVASHNHPYNEDTTPYYGGTPVDFFLKNCSEYVITENVLHFDGNTTRIGVFVQSDTTGEGDNGIIANNIFSGTFDYAVWLATGCTGVKVGPNVYSGTIGTANVNDASTNNAIIDGKTETTGTWTPSLTFGGGATGMTYSTQTAKYNIVGGVFHFRIDITLTAKGSSTGNADISLPSTLPGNLNLANNAAVGMFAIYSGMATVSSPIARSTSATNLRLTNQNAGAVANMTEANFTDTTAIVIIGTAILE